MNFERKMKLEVEEILNKVVEDFEKVKNELEELQESVQRVKLFLKKYYVDHKY